MNFETSQNYGIMYHSSKESQMEEIWKDIAGFEKYYQVSNLGRIKRLPRMSKHSCPGYFKPYGERIMVMNIANPKKYVSAKLTVDGITITRQLHRVVLSAFVPCPAEGLVVNHKDGNKHNNCLDNLEWVTYKENANHAKNMGLTHYAVGEDSGQVKTNNKDVAEIKKMLQLGEVQKVIAQKFGISKKMVTDINTGRTWKHIKI